MHDCEKSRTHILRHVPSGKWLELWVDGWYLTDNINDATQLADKKDTENRLLPGLTRAFTAEIEIFFLHAFPNGNQNDSTTHLKSATG